LRKALQEPKGGGKAAVLAELKQLLQKGALLSTFILLKMADPKWEILGGLPP
jgi:hypothetical protein